MSAQVTRDGEGSFVLKVWLSKSDFLGCVQLESDRSLAASPYLTSQITILVTALVVAESQKRGNNRTKDADADTILSEGYERE